MTFLNLSINPFFLFFYNLCTKMSKNDQINKTKKRKERSRK